MVYSQKVFRQRVSPAGQFNNVLIHRHYGKRDVQLYVMIWFDDMILKITMHKMPTANSIMLFRCLRHKRQTYNVYILWASLDIFGPQSYTSRSSKLLMAPMTHGTCKLVDLSQLPKWITMACLFRKSSAWQKENRTWLEQKASPSSTGEVPRHNSHH